MHTDVEMSVMIQIVCNQVDHVDGGSITVWARIHHGGRMDFVHCCRWCIDGHQISRRDPTPRHSTTHNHQRWNCLACEHARPHAARVSREFLQRRNVETFTLTRPYARLNPNRISIGCIESTCMSEQSTTPRHFRSFLRHCTLA